MKTNICALVALVFFLLLGVLWMPVKSAVVVSDLTAVQYDQTLSTSTVSWKVEMIAGFPSESISEIFVWSNQNQAIHHFWSQPEQVGIEYDQSGNLNVRAGSTTSVTQPLGAFNTVLIQISDTTQFFTTELKDGVVNGTSFRNLFADDNDTALRAFDQLSFSGFGSIFNLDSAFHHNSYDTGSTVTVTGIWSVPEPGIITILFPMCASALLLRRR